MKLQLLFIYFFVTISCLAQTKLTLVKEQSISVKDSITNVDTFQFTYSVKHNRIKKWNSYANFKYNNLKLGNLWSLNTFNPLKSILFYGDFNTVVVLDNRLSQVAMVDFNTLTPLKTITKVSAAHDNKIWLFNQNTQRLELFDFITLKTIAKTTPISQPIITITSDYNYIWATTKSNFLCYNYLGNLLYKVPISKQYDKIEQHNENVFLKHKSELFFLDKKTKQISAVKLKHKLIESFSVSQQNLYIYSLNKLYTYQLN